MLRPPCCSRTSSTRRRVWWLPLRVYAVLAPVFLLAVASATAADPVPTVVVSWYTPAYAPQAQRLLASCSKYSVRCDVVPVSDAAVRDTAGSFQLFKVVFMLAKLLEHGAQGAAAIVYVDADLIVEAPVHTRLRKLWGQGAADRPERTDRDNGGAGLVGGVCVWYLVGCLVGWLVGWLVACLVACLCVVGWLVVWQ